MCDSRKCQFDPTTPVAYDRSANRVDRGPRRDGGSERRRVLVIVLFVALSLAAALVLAFFYTMPSTGF